MDPSVQSFTPTSSWRPDLRCRPRSWPVTAAAAIGHVTDADATTVSKGPQAARTGSTVWPGTSAHAERAAGVANRQRHRSQLPSGANLPLTSGACPYIAFSINREATPNQRINIDGTARSGSPTGAIGDGRPVADGTKIGGLLSPTHQPASTRLPSTTRDERRRIQPAAITSVHSHRIFLPDWAPTAG